MNFRENLRLAFSCVKSNKMRSILTMLGIIIGISAVITISTIGTSLKQSIAKSINDLAGVNTLYAYISYNGDYDDYDYSTIPGVTRIFTESSNFESVSRALFAPIGFEL